MLDKETYRQWTAEFDPNSTFEGSWDKGSEIRFIGPDEDGKRSGMIGKIVENKPSEFISIEYFGVIENGIEDTTSDKVKGWAGSHENYTFKEENGVTNLTVELDSDDQFAEMFKEMWPKGLKKLKEISEK